MSCHRVASRTTYLSPRLYITVQFSYRIYVSRSLIVEIMTATLTRRTISIFSRPENCPSVSDVVLISGGILFHANRPATEKLRGLKPVVLVRVTSSQPGHKWRRRETGLIIDTRKLCRHQTSKLTWISRNNTSTRERRRGLKKVGKGQKVAHFRQQISINDFHLEFSHCICRKII